ncbi:PRTRC system protein B [Chryseobacterium gotjawalense]|uniref:PRTRC system protein B n=1 Tax=Chryseobacterium gotjawalense TaxID=3042315 RepID=A0ABY8RFX2_9FLAO|nr:PRTRC system protein B [Chryseobacterium sp. wdc7]WHF51909.1 PRTRC system protein B [Chryseobacterium sp. wdc7]
MKNDKTENEIIDITNNFGTLYHPKSALVFYQTESPNSETYVEYFDMDKCGSPVNAHPLTVREAQRLSKTLNIQNKKDKDFLKPKGIISSNILFIDSFENGKVIWFTKEQERDLFFVKNLNIPNGKANVPPLLWIANKQNLKIFALECDERPDENTPLFHAPFFNVYENGNVCMGTVNVKIKNSASLEEFTESWEHYFFNSYFSHLLHQNPIKGNCVNRWKKQIETKDLFPKEILVKNNRTLKELLQ